MTHLIVFKLKNIGTAPAENIDVTLHFPDGFELSSKKATFETSEPTAPLKPGEIFGLGIHPFTLTGRTLQNYHPPSFPSIGGNTIKKTNSYNVDLENVDILKHHQSYEYPRIYLRFHNYESVSGFNIDYQISAGNIQQMMKGVLNVSVEKG